MAKKIQEVEEAKKIQEVEEAKPELNKDGLAKGSIVSDADYKKVMLAQKAKKK